MRKLEDNIVKRNMITFKVSDDELNIIQSFMDKYGMENRSEFIRSLVLEYIGE